MTETSNTANHAIEAGDYVYVLKSEYGSDGFTGQAEVLRVDGDELLVSMLHHNWEGWFNLQRIKR